MKLQLPQPIAKTLASTSAASGNAASDFIFLNFTSVETARVRTVFRFVYLVRRLVTVWAGCDVAREWPRGACWHCELWRQKLQCENSSGSFVRLLELRHVLSGEGGLGQEDSQSARSRHRASHRRCLFCPTARVTSCPGCSPACSSPSSGIQGSQSASGSYCWRPKCGVFTQSQSTESQTCSRRFSSTAAASAKSSIWGRSSRSPPQRRSCCSSRSVATAEDSRRLPHEGV